MHENVTYEHRSLMHFATSPSRSSDKSCLPNNHGVYPFIWLQISC